MLGTAAEGQQDSAATARAAAANLYLWSGCPVQWNAHTGCEHTFYGYLSSQKAFSLPLHNSTFLPRVTTLVTCHQKQPSTAELPNLLFSKWGKLFEVTSGDCLNPRGWLKLIRSCLHGLVQHESSGNGHPLQRDSCQQLPEEAVTPLNDTADGKGRVCFCIYCWFASTAHWLVFSSWWKAPGQFFCKKNCCNSIMKRKSRQDRCIQRLTSSWQR